MEQKLIYVKADLNTIVSTQTVTLGQIIKLYGSDKKLVEMLKECQILQIEKDKHCKYAITILKVMEAIQKKVPNVLVMNEGESDFIIEYVPARKNKSAWEIIKTIFISFTVFFGAAFTIMTFNEDVSVRDVLVLFYKLVTGETSVSSGILELSYCIGLPIGILVLFNHFSKRKTKLDPTPLQVQLRVFETNENKAIIENSSRSGETIDVE